MKVFRLISSILAVLILPASLAATDPPPSCKPVKHYSVSGCELLSGQTCPSGYHKQVVDPPNSMMKGPTFLMCVPDKPPAKERPPKVPPSQPARSPQSVP